jgi:hypothetical protein
MVYYYYLEWYSMLRYSMLAMLGSVGWDGVRSPLRAVVWACWCVCMWLCCPVTVSISCRKATGREGEVPLAMPTGTERI